MPAPRHRWLAWPLLVALAHPRAAQAEPSRPADVPLAVEPAPIEPVPPASPAPPVPADSSAPTPAPVPADSSAPTPAPVPADSPTSEPTIPDPTRPITPDEPEVVAVAVGLGPSAPGSKPERAVVDALERSVAGSPAPRTRVRRLRAGAGDGAAICRERRDDLVILLEYLPDRPDAVLVARDCRLDRDLGIRGQPAASDPDLTAVLWDEHRSLVRQGVKERKVRVSPKVRRGLIAGGAILAVGLAIGLVLASSLRRDTVVLTVGP
ncbi:MAG: hypothetical protein JNL82_02420 [Myxococcales bacterium]|nr:hypothetical protein [Myxococcales bacterium]